MGFSYVVVVRPSNPCATSPIHFWTLDHFWPGRRLSRFPISEKPALGTSASFRSLIQTPSTLVLPSQARCSYTAALSVVWWEALSRHVQDSKQPREIDLRPA